jgi:hypothetical protein
MTPITAAAAIIIIIIIIPHKKTYQTCNKTNAQLQDQE